MTTELIERLRQHADTFEKSGFAVDGLVKDYREAADTIEGLLENTDSLQTEPCEDVISRKQAIDKWNNLSSRGRTEFDQVLMMLPSVQPKVIRCKDCGEWHKGKNCDGRDWYSDEGYCCVHRIITGENYYCGDAERR